MNHYESFSLAVSPETLDKQARAKAALEAVYPTNHPAQLVVQPHVAPQGSLGHDISIPKTTPVHSTLVETPRPLPTPVRHPKQHLNVELLLVFCFAGALAGLLLRIWKNKRVAQATHVYASGPGSNMVEGIDEEPLPWTL